MNKKRFLSWVLVFTMLFSLTVGMQKAEAEPSGTPDPHLVGWGIHEIYAFGTETGADQAHAIKCVMNVPNMVPFLQLAEIRTGTGDTVKVLDSNYLIEQDPFIIFNFGSNLVYLKINVGGNPNQVKYYELNVIRAGTVEKSELIIKGETIPAINGLGNVPAPPAANEPIYSGPYTVKVNVDHNVEKIATGDIVSASPGTPLLILSYPAGDILIGDIPLKEGENKILVIELTPSKPIAYFLIISRGTFISSKEINNVGLNIAYLSFTTAEDYRIFFYKLVPGENPVAPTVEQIEAANDPCYTNISTGLSGRANSSQSITIPVEKMGTKYTCYFVTRYGTDSTSEIASVSFTTKSLPESCRILSVAGVSDTAPLGESMSYEPISEEDAANYSVSLPSTVKAISPKDIRIADGATMEMFSVNFVVSEELRKEERWDAPPAKVAVTDLAPMALYDGVNTVYAKVTKGSDSLYFRIMIDRAIDLNNPAIPASTKLLSVAGLKDGIITGKTETIDSVERSLYEYRLDAPNSLTQIFPSDIGVPMDARVDLYTQADITARTKYITEDAPLVLKTGENIFYVTVVQRDSYSRSISAERTKRPRGPQSNYRVIINRSEYSNKLTINAGTGGSVTTGKSGYFATGAVVTVVATANSGYKFKGWSTNNGGTFENIANASTTFTVPEGNVDITASFVANTSGGATGGGGNDRPSAGGTTGGGAASGGGATGGTTGGGTTGGGSTTPSGKTEPGTPGNTGDAAKKLNDLMGKLGDKAQQEVVVNDAAKLLGDLSKATEEVKTNEGAVQAAGNVRDAINNASKIVNEVEAAGADAKIVGQVKDVLEASAQALDKITDDAAKLKATGDILAEGSKFLKNAGPAEGTEALKQALVDMAKKAVADASTSELKPTVTGGTVKAKITAEVAAELLKSAAHNAQVITELNKNLAEGGIKTALEKTVTLDLGTNPDMKKLSAEMSGKVLSDLSKAGVKNLEIVSGESSLKIKSDSVPTGTKSFSVEVKSVDMTQKGLTKSQKKFIEAHTVIDINASITNAKGKTSNVTSLKSKVEVEIPYTLKEGQDPTKVEVYVKLDNGTFKKYIGTYNSETKSATVGVDRF